MPGMTAGRKQKGVGRYDKDLRELPPGYWAATILALRYSIPLPRLRDRECCLTPALSGPREAHAGRRGRYAFRGARGALRQTCPGPLQRDVRQHGGTSCDEACPISVPPDRGDMVRPV